MDIDIRVAKVEVEVAPSKEAVKKLEHTTDDLRGVMERGFAEQRGAMAEVRTSMERGFAEQRAAMLELRKAMVANMRWMFGLMLTSIFFTVGLLVRVGGIF